MPQRSDDSLRKVTLNLYETDCVWLEKHLGHGWSERVREQIRMYVAKQNNYTLVRRKIGDLANDQ